jgi:hypothetical protein
MKKLILIVLLGFSFVQGYCQDPNLTPQYQPTKIGLAGNTTYAQGILNSVGGTYSAGKLCITVDDTLRYITWYELATRLLLYVPRAFTLNSHPFTGSSLSLTKADIGLSAVPDIDATNASNISSGTLGAARLPGTALVSTGSYSDPVWLTLSKGFIGLSHVDDTPDANKPVSTAQQAALDLKVSVNVIENTTLTDDATKLPTNHLVKTNLDALNGSLSASIATKEPTIPTGTSSQYVKGDKSLGTLDKAAVGLANVDNTSDINKPVSIPTQAAIDAIPNASTRLQSSIIEKNNADTRDNYNFSGFTQLVSDGYVNNGGYQVKLNSTTLVQVYRHDATNTHPGNGGRGQIWARTKSLLTNAWSGPVVAYQADSTNAVVAFGGKIRSNGKLFTFFNTFVGYPYTSSTDTAIVFQSSTDAVTWSGITKLVGSVGANAYGPIINLPSGEALITISSNSFARHYGTRDGGTTWYLRDTVYKVSDGHIRLEPWVEYCGNGRMICVARNNDGLDGSTDWVYKSTDTGHTWSFVGNMPTFPFYCTLDVEPMIKWDSIRGNLICTRIARTTGNDFTYGADKICMYTANVNTLFSTGTSAFKLNRIINRPFMNRRSIYGIQYADWINDSTLAGVITDGKIPDSIATDNGGTEVDNIYAYKIEYSTNSLGLHSNVDNSGYRYYNSETNGEEIRNNEQVFFYDSVTHSYQVIAPGNVTFPGMSNGYYLKYEATKSTLVAWKQTATATANNTNNWGDGSFGGGTGCSIPGNGSITSGLNNRDSSDYSIVEGSNNSLAPATSNNMVLGQNNRVTTNNNTIVGNNVSTVDAGGTNRNNVLMLVDGSTKTNTIRPRTSSYAQVIGTNGVDIGFDSASEDYVRFIQNVGMVYKYFYASNATSLTVMPKAFGDSLWAAARNWATSENTTLTGTTTITAANRNTLFEADATSASFSVTLPTAATLPVGTMYIFKKTTAANTVTLDPAGSVQINGASTYAFSTLGQVVVVQWNGTSYKIWNNQNQGTVTSVGITAGTGINVTGSPVTGAGSITVAYNGDIPFRGQPGSGSTMAASSGFYELSGTTGTLTLPVVTSGVVLHFKSIASGTWTLSSNGGGSDIYDVSAGTSITVLTGGVLTLVGSATKWDVLNK